jgi:O-antigen/teichoic acid export membrane protein
VVEDLAKVAEDSARGSFFLISGTATSTVIAAIASIVVGRLMGPELYGQYALALVTPQLLYLFADLGISQSVTRFTAIYNSQGEKYRLARTIKHAMILKALFGFTLFATNYVLADSFAIVFFQRPDLASYLRIVSFSILFEVVFTTAASAFVGLDKTELSAVTTNIQNLAKTIISVALVFLGFGVAGALIGHVTSYIVAAVASIMLLLFTLSKTSTIKDHHRATENISAMLHYGIPLYLSILLVGLVPAFQGFVLANTATDADIGNFKAASNFATLMTILAIPIRTALLPAFSKIDSSAKEKIRLFFKLVNKYTAVLIVPATVLMIIYSNQIVNIVYGSTYQSAPLFLATYSLVYLLVGIGYITLTSFYSGLGETRKTFLISLLTFVTLAVLSPVLASAYGVQGLIVAFLIASFIGTAYALFAARRTFQIEFGIRTLLKVYLVSAVSAVPSLLMLRLARLSNVVSLAAGSIIYVMIYITLIARARIMTSIEIRTVTKIINKIPLLRIIATPVLRYFKKVSGKLV